MPDDARIIRLPGALSEAESTERRLACFEIETPIWRARPSLLLIVPHFKNYALIWGASFGAIWIVQHWQALAVLRPYLELWPARWIPTVLALSAMICRLIRIASIRYEITNTYLRIDAGVFSRWHEQLELCRIRKVAVSRPWWLRIAGRGHLLVRLWDQDSGVVWIQGVKQPLQLREQLIYLAEIERERQHFNVSERFR